MASVKAVALAAAWFMVTASCVTTRAKDARPPESPPNYVFRPGPLCSTDGSDLQIRAGQLGGFVDKNALLAFVRRQTTGAAFISVENDPKKTSHKTGGATGFAIGKRKMPSGEFSRGILTNHHVIRHALRIWALPIEIAGDGRSFKTGKKIALTIAAASEAYDVAYLVPAKGALPPSLRSFFPRLTRPPFLTEVLWHFGMTTFCDFGMVSDVAPTAFFPARPAHALLLTNGDYGDSGGPIVDVEGLAVGIMVNYLWPHLTFLPISEALRMLEIATK